MAYSIQREVSDGTLQTLTLRIAYFKKTHIFVYVDDKIADGSAGYSWVWDGERIRLNKVVPVGIEVMIRRKTPMDAPFHNFRQGAVFKDVTMDENFIQQLYINQENVEGLSATDFYSDLDLHNYRMKNVGTAISDADAVSLGQYRADALGANQYRTLAEGSKVAAKASEVASAASAAASLVSENKSKASETAAKLSEVNSKESEDIVVPLVPIVDKAARDAAVASAQAVTASAEAKQAVIDVKNLGAVPIGAVLAFIKEPLPAGYLALRGGKFDKLTFPDLFTYLGTDDLPNFTDRTPKMTGTDLDLLEKQGWCWPTHSHSMSEDRHAHSRGTMEITGGFGYDRAAFSGPPFGAFTQGANLTQPGNTATGGDRSYNVDFWASRTWSGTTSEHAHMHTINPAGNSDRVEVDRIGVVYAIKAAGVLANEGMAQLDGVLGRVGAIENTYASVKPFTDDLNNVSKLGTVSWRPITANIPAVGSYGVVFTMPSDPTKPAGATEQWLTQIASSTDGVMYFRRRTNHSTWSTWERVFTSSNMKFVY